MANSVYHLAQQSFGAGEISPEVANRIDLEKYQYALLKAKNVYIRPYGPAYKRGGMVYCCATKYADRKNILVEFNFSKDINYLLEIGHKYIRIHRNGTYLNVELSAPFEESELDNLRFAQSVDVMFVASGNRPVKMLTRYTETSWALTDFDFDSVYFDASLTSSVETADEITVTPSGTTGNISLSASAALFTSGQVGNYIQLTQNVASASSKVDNGTTGTITVGDTWKILTGGTWTGTVTVQRLRNGVWEEFRSYQSTNNYNVTETGTVREETQIRAVCSISSGTCTLTLSRLPYDKTGYARITSVSSSTLAYATVVEQFGNTAGTKEYAWGAWGTEFGYPSCLCFFQDRLCFAASSKQPHVVWMSKTGDYHNFSVKKVDGDVLADSAISAAFISRKQHKIMHLVPGVDLLVLTDGNEWLVSGGEVVTPSNMSPRVQTTRGCNNCEPITVGNRLLFVQARGSTVRDMGYTFESDSYVGADLNLLAAHLVRGREIVDITYKQEPNSMVYCVRDDGKAICLSYIREQEIYAWSTIETSGNIEAVCCIGEGDNDVVYAVVKRGNKRYIEYFANDVYSDYAQDYNMLDSSVQITLEEKGNTFTAAHLAGKTISVLADGREHNGIVVGSDGSFTVPAKVLQVTAGIPYDMELQLPNAELGLKDGTTQGRMKMVSSVTLRLRESLGGKIGADFDNMDSIKYDEFFSTSAVKTFSGDKKVSVPMGGYNQNGRVCIKSSDSYPFQLMAIIREVTFGG